MLKTKNLFRVLLTLCLTMAFAFIPMFSTSASAATITWTVSGSNSHEGCSVYLFDNDVDVAVIGETAFSKYEVKGTIKNVGTSYKPKYTATGSFDTKFSEGDTVYCVVVNEGTYYKISATITDMSVTINISGISNDDFKEFSDWGDKYDTVNEFTIDDIDDLLKFRHMVNSGKNFSGKTVSLGNSFSNSDNHLTNPIGYYDDSSVSKYFAGTFDGNGKTVTLKISDVENGGGIFCLLL